MYSRHRHRYRGLIRICIRACRARALVWPFHARFSHRRSVRCAHAGLHSAGTRHRRVAAYSGQEPATLARPSYLYEYMYAAACYE